MSKHYSYNGHTIPVNLVELNEEVEASGIAPSGYEGSVWSQGCNTTSKPPCTHDCIQPCNGLLVLKFAEELSTEDKSTIDYIVSKY